MRRALAVMAVVAAVLVLGACDQLDAADDLGDTRVLVERRAGSIEVSAPTWYAPETLVVLCPTAPIESGQPFEPATVQLSDSCLSYGRFGSERGLEASLGLGALDAARFRAFDAASEWWLVLVQVRGEAAGAMYRTVLEGGPIDPGVTPGPSQAGST